MNEFEQQELEGKKDFYKLYKDKCKELKKPIALGVAFGVVAGAAATVTISPVAGVGALATMGLFIPHKIAQSFYRNAYELSTANFSDEKKAKHTGVVKGARNLTAVFMAAGLLSMATFAAGLAISTEEKRSENKTENVDSLKETKAIPSANLLTK